MKGLKRQRRRGIINKQGGRCYTCPTHLRIDEGQHNSATLVDGKAICYVCNRERRTTA